MPIEQLARIIAVGAIVLYVTGLLAVNGYLLRYGVSDFSLVRTKFIYTGGLILASALIPNALVAAFLLVWWDIFKGRKSREDYAVAVPLLFAVAIVLLFTITIFDLLLNIGDPSLRSRAPFPPPIGGPASIIVGAAIGLGFMIFRLANDISSTMRRDHEARGLVPVALSAAYSTLAIAVCAIYVAIFMAVAYPRVPSQFGGGQPYEVRLVVAKEAIPAAKELGLSFSPNGQLSEPVQLLYEADQQYVLRLSRDRTALIDKGLVSGLTSQK